MPNRIDVRIIIENLSNALDLAEAATFKDGRKLVRFEMSLPNTEPYQHNYSSHAARVAVTSLYLGKQMKLADSEMELLYLSALMHDIGAVSAYAKVEIETNYMLNHVNSGYEIISHLLENEAMAQIILCHHENANGSGPLGIPSNEIPLLSKIIHLADVVEMLFDDDMPYYLQNEAIVEKIKDQEGVLFTTELVTTFLEVVKKMNYWLDLQNNRTSSLMERKWDYRINLDKTDEIIMRIAMVFAGIVDSKSPYTARHSKNVAKTSYEMAKHLGMSETHCYKIKLSGYLHDLGKLAVPTDILDKIDLLTEVEFEIIKSHVYYTQLLLSGIPGFEEICKWAGSHHEQLNGQGYPSRIGSEEISLEGKILAVADVYTALIETRPYRISFGREEAFAMMKFMAERDMLDLELIDTLIELKMGKPMIK